MHVLTQVCHKLGVRIVSPYRALGQEGREIIYPAFIPEFGSVLGTVVDVLEAPRTAREVGLGDQGSENYVGRSFLNLTSIQLDPLKYVTEMLDEWGYYGDAEKTPQFMRSRS